MDRRRFIKVISCLPLYGLCPDARIATQDVPFFDTKKVLLLKSGVAGFQYYRGEKVWPEISPGDPVTLRREPSNPHDAKAVALYWKEEKLGYIPRVDNTVIANLLDQGAGIDARISEKNNSPNPSERLKVEVATKG